MSHGVAGSVAERPRVYAVALELTRYCNQGCDYCYNAWRAEPHAAGPADDRWLQRIDRLVSAFEIDHFTLTGGEPFAYRGLFDCMDRLREHGVPMQLISNGGLVDDALAERVAVYAPRFIQVTLNGPDADTHEAMVGAGHFERTLKGVRALVRAGVRLVGCVVVSRRNAARVGEALALWQSLGVRDIALSRFSPAGYAANHVAQLLPSQADVTLAFEQALPFARDAGMRISVTMPIPPCAVEVERFAPLHFGGCAIGTTMQEFALGPDGRLRNCTLHGSAVGAGRDIADPDLDLRELFRHRDVTEYRKVTPSFCRGCQHEHSCGGGCGAAMQWVLGRRDQLPDPFVAQHIDTGLARQLARGARKPTRLEVIS